MTTHSTSPDTTNIAKLKAAAKDAPTSKAEATSAPIHNADTKDTVAQHATPGGTSDTERYNRSQRRADSPADSPLVPDSTCNGQTDTGPEGTCVLGAVAVTLTGHHFRGIANVPDVRDLARAFDIYHPAMMPSLHSDGEADPHIRIALSVEMLRVVEAKPFVYRRALSDLWVGTYSTAQEGAAGWAAPPEAVAAVLSLAHAHGRWLQRCSAGDYFNFEIALPELERVFERVPPCGNWLPLVEAGFDYLSGVHIVTTSDVIEHRPRTGLVERYEIASGLLRASVTTRNLVDAPKDYFA
jgi:hypothetical protein